MRLLMVRHGESRHSLEKIIATHEACPGLTARGIQQASTLGLHLKPTLPTNTVLLSSPARRARETAEQLSQALPLEPGHSDNGLLEIATGKAEGLRWDEYEALYGYFDLVAEPHRPFAPDGESWIDFINRVDAVLTRWSEQYKDQTVIAVTHAGFIVAAFLVLFAIPASGVRARIEPGFTSITEWQMTKGVWTLICFNDLNHLNRTSATFENFSSQNPPG
jgi:broad specificity phosphatase PhoE